MDRTLRNAYFAGLIDGEGCISIMSNGSTRLRSTGEKNKTAVIQVKMTCHKTILAIREHFGVGHIVWQAGERSHWKESWRWRVTCKQARQVAEIIRPYLITKADDLERAFPAAGFVDKRFRPESAYFTVK